MTHQKVAMICGIFLSIGAPAARAADYDCIKIPAGIFNLVDACLSLARARVEVVRANKLTEKTDHLGGHAIRAVHSIDAAVTRVHDAVRFAETHHQPGPKREYNLQPETFDVGGSPELAGARDALIDAVKKVEAAETEHSVKGTLGGNGKKAVEAIVAALAEVKAAAAVAEKAEKAAADRK
jgi:hypothetical protein